MQKPAFLVLFVAVISMVIAFLVSVSCYNLSLVSGRAWSTSTLVLFVFVPLAVGGMWAGVHASHRNWVSPAILSLVFFASVVLVRVAGDVRVSGVEDLGVVAVLLGVFAAILFVPFLLFGWRRWRLSRGRDAKSDGAGHLDFHDGFHGRTLFREKGDVVAWLEYGETPAGYREDGDAKRYRVVVGTKAQLVARARRTTSLQVLTTLAAIIVAATVTLASLEAPTRVRTGTSCCTEDSLASP